jgi:hypothetical protein
LLSINDLMTEAEASFETSYDVDVRDATKKIKYIKPIMRTHVLVLTLTELTRVRTVCEPTH